MINTLLFDLDDTLLENNMETFIPAYLSLLSQHMDQFAPRDEFVAHLLHSIQMMIENDDPEQTLERVFAEDFYSAVGVLEEELRPHLMDFYASVFPSLEELTKPRPEALEIIQTVMDQGLEIVIATNPLFPMTAIQQRLDWAQIPAKDFEYTLITSYEQFHFAKPKIAYYAEILGRLGRDPHEAVMIGNDPKADLEPAAALGIPVFHVNHELEGVYPGGELGSVLDWVAEVDEKKPAQTESNPRAVLGRLEGQLSAILGYTQNLGPEEWVKRPSPEEWAPSEILSHLRDVEAEVYLPRIETILAEDSPHLSAFDTDQWAKERNYIKQSGPKALECFTRSRKELIAQLSELQVEDWQRPASHAFLGPTTLLEILEIAVEHDRIHLEQIRTDLNLGSHRSIEHSPTNFHDRHPPSQQK